jgi:hypothetical protein
MMLRACTCTLFLLVFGGLAVASAQGLPDLPPSPPGVSALAPDAPQPPEPPTQSPPPPPQRPGTTRPSPAPPPPPGVLAVEATRRVRGRELNLQVEITISDQSGTLAPEKKVVSMLVADSTMGRIRASADAQRAGMGMVGTGLNVDARPSVLEGDRILLELTVEYTPLREGGQVTQRPTILNESLSVILQNGKPMIVSQAADPVTDRKMTVEVRASIMK